MTAQLLRDSFLNAYGDFPAHMNAIGEFTYLRTYSRFLVDKGRRETWKETCKRSVEYKMKLHIDHCQKEGIAYNIHDLRKEAEEFFDNQYNLRQFLSGRTLWVGGADTGVADKYPLANFNCSFTNIRSIQSFKDLFYLLLVGTGVGFKVIKEIVDEFPAVRNNLKIKHLPYEPVPARRRNETTSLTRRDDKTMRITVGDAKEGWMDALGYYFEVLTEDCHKGVEELEFRYDHVRENGARLKTFGGTASGPEPLWEMFTGVDKVIKNLIEPGAKPLEVVAENYVKLRPIHCLDIANLIGNNVVVGGVRRTSEIGLGDEDDTEFIFAKYGLYGIWGEEAFERHNEIEQKLIELGMEVPHFWESMKQKFYNVEEVIILESGKEDKIKHVFNSPEAAIAKAEELGIKDFFPFPCNETRCEYIGHRKMSNNSVAFFKKPSRKKLNLLFTIMQAEGEPGFVNLYEAARRRLAPLGITDPIIIMKVAKRIGLNPCAEIILDEDQVCNLTTINVTAFVYKDKNGSYTLDTKGLLRAQELSAREGVRMSLVTAELPHWDKVQKRDRLIGTSMTGWKDAMEMIEADERDEEYILASLKEVVTTTAEEYARALRIPVPLLDTTIKPEGTQSLVAGGVSSGLHVAHAPYFIRRIRVSANDAVAKTAKALGWVVNPENDTPGNTWDEKMENAKTLVFDFPVKSGSKRTKNDVGVNEQFDTYFRFQKAYTSHNSSNTIHVRPEEWGIAEQRVWDGWDNFVGVSFLAHNGGTYKLAPYEEITKEKYEELVANMAPFDTKLLQSFESGTDTKEDYVEDKADCSGGACPSF